MDRHLASGSSARGALVSNMIVWLSACLWLMVHVALLESHTLKVHPVTWSHTHANTLGIIRILSKQVSVPPLMLLSVVWAEVGLVRVLVSVGGVSVSGIHVMPIPSHTHTHTHTVQWLLQFLSFLWCFVALSFHWFIVFFLFCCLNFCLVFRMTSDLALVVLVCLRMLSLFLVCFYIFLPILFPILFLHSLYHSSFWQSSDPTELDNDLKHVMYSTVL